MGSIHDAVPRLTRRMTAESIARSGSGEVSKILADLDKRAGKRRQGNVNPVQSMEFALRHAIDHLGAARVAALLGIGEASLRKAVNPNAEGRRVDEAKLSLASVRSVISALAARGKPEF